MAKKTNNQLETSGERSADDVPLEEHVELLVAINLDSFCSRELLEYVKRMNKHEQSTSMQTCCRGVCRHCCSSANRQA
jgi:hypothetical protein